MTDILPELLVAGLVVGPALGLSGLTRVIGRAATGLVALVAIWLLLEEGPCALVDQVQSVFDATGEGVDFAFGFSGGLLIALAIDRERRRREREQSIVPLIQGTSATGGWGAAA